MMLQAWKNQSKLESVFKDSGIKMPSFCQKRKPLKEQVQPQYLTMENKATGTAHWRAQPLNKTLRFRTGMMDTIHLSKPIEQN